MRREQRLSWLWIVALAAATACQSPTVSAGGDAGTTDSGFIHTTQLDSGPGNSTPSDSGTADAGQDDPSDAGACHCPSKPSGLCTTVGPAPCLCMIACDDDDAGPDGGLDAGPDAGRECGPDLTCLGNDEYPSPDNVLCAMACPSGEICTVNGICETPGYSESNGTVTDQVTGLVWQQATEMYQCPMDTQGLCTWTDAQAYCANLQLGGFTGGWRLPDIDELFSLVDEGTSPAIDATAFPNVQTAGAIYWSVTPVAGTSASSIWSVVFDTGYVDVYGTGPNAFARCVR